MNDLNKRLVEVEYILRELDNEYLKKIPKELWEYIENNKDKDYMFKLDNDPILENQNLNMDTISILTYINMEYLLDDEQKKDLIKHLMKDELIAEQIKSKNYNPDNIFKNRIDTQINKKVALVEIKSEKWYEKIFSYFKKFLKINNRV